MEADFGPEERDRALASGDLEWVKRQSGASDDFQALVVLHKVRLECVNIDMSLREESLRWLRDNGYRRYGGLPLPDAPEVAAPD